MNLPDWYVFVAEYLTADQIAGLSRADPQERREYVFSSIGAPRLIHGFNKSPTSGFVERMKAMIRAAPDFWRGRDSKAKSENFDQLRLLLDGSHSNHAPADLRRLGIFDRVLYLCPIHELWCIYTNRGFEVNEHNIAVLALRMGGLSGVKGLV